MTKEEMIDAILIMVPDNPERMDAARIKMMREMNDEEIQKTYDSLTKLAQYGKNILDRMSPESRTRFYELSRRQNVSLKIEAVKKDLDNLIQK